MPELNNDRLVWMYTQMLRIREFEERVKRTFEEHPGVIRGHTHLADGAEASIVGSLATLRKDDQLLTTYRCHGYPIALGTDPNAIMAEIYGRKDGLCGGYGGPWGVEVLSAELRSLPMEEEFTRAYETTIAQFGAGVR